MIPPEIESFGVFDPEYLGDGLYAAFDGWQVVLWAEREEGVHYVALEPEVLKSLLNYVKRPHRTREPG